MKTTLKNLVITREVANFFKASYAFKMGGTQTVVFPTGERFEFDDREYYSGRGAKYNSSIRHDIKGDVIVSLEALKAYIQRVNERNTRIKEAQKAQKSELNRIKVAKANGVYSINENGFVELSDLEYSTKTFDASRLAKTLQISVKDAELLKSTGKTYVFAKSANGNVYELYHSDLSCNGLSIHVSIATPERVAEFVPSEWQSAPYADLVGQTTNQNHFVC
jgi:hypothetical protein